MEKFFVVLHHLIFITSRIAKILRILGVIAALVLMAPHAQAQDAPEIPSTLQFDQAPPLYSALPVPPRPQAPQIAVEQAQVVMRFDHEDGSKIVVEAVARVALLLAPVSSEHPAPLSKDAVMLCRPYNVEGRLFLRCGMDHYVVAGISFQAEK